MDKVGKSPSEKEALTAAKTSVLKWVNEEDRKIGIEPGPKRLTTIKCSWDGVDWSIWIRCNADKFTTRVFYYIYNNDSSTGHLTPFIPVGTFYEKEGKSDDE